MGIVSTLSDAGQTEQLIAGAIPYFKAHQLHQQSKKVSTQCKEPYNPDILHVTE